MATQEYRRQKFPAELVTVTEEIHNGKFHFLCSAGGLYHEISLENTKRLLNCSCNLKNITEQHLAALGEYSNF